MKVARLFFFGFICVLGTSYTRAVPNSRIFNGEDVKSGQYPWVASVRVDNSHACMGSIIGEKYILTAGHCVSDIGVTPIQADRVSVRCGSINQYSGGKIVQVQSIRIHPSFGNFLHDLAILILAEPLSFSERINKINIAKKDETIAADTAVSVTGWGLLHSSNSTFKLQQATLSVITATECEKRAGYGYESALCLHHAENQGTCRGDDGASVVTNNTLVGTISFAFGACGTKYPDVACKLSFYADWINKIISS